MPVINTHIDSDHDPPERHGDVSVGHHRVGIFYKGQKLETYGLMQQLDGRNLLDAEMARGISNLLAGPTAAKALRTCRLGLQWN